MGFDINQAIKLLIVLAISVSFLLYFVFSLIVIRQVHLLNRTLLTGLSPTLKMASYGHAFFALILLIFSILKAANFLF